MCRFALSRRSHLATDVFDYAIEILGLAISSARYPTQLKGTGRSSKTQLKFVRYCVKSSYHNGRYVDTSRVGDLEFLPLSDQNVYCCALMTLWKMVGIALRGSTR